MGKVIMYTVNMRDVNKKIKELLKESSLEESYLNKVLEKIDNFNSNIDFSKNKEELETSLIQSTTKFMESNSMKSLAKIIVDINEGLELANPKKVNKKSSFFDRLVGIDLVENLDYKISRDKVLKLVEKGRAERKSGIIMLEKISEMLKQSKINIVELKLNIVAKKIFIEEYGDEIKKGGNEFFDPLERHKRKLINMHTVLSSSLMTHNHLLLAQAQAIDMIDRFDDIASVLVPIWSQYTMSIASGNISSNEDLTLANKAHDDLVKSMKNLIKGK